jgi:hypothetical protein
LAAGWRHGTFSLKGLRKRGVVALTDESPPRWMVKL